MGAVIAILDEYFITDSAGKTYKLYKTNQGNWHDIPSVNKGVDNTILRQLKFTVDSQDQQS
ncbi:MAG: hypothetical protein ACKVOW_13960 [Chitinophagaceae bacterium]